MRSRIEFCQACQIDLQTAFDNMDVLEDNCARNACPFTEQLVQARKRLDRHILEVEISPNPILEGSVFEVNWCFAGDAEYLETIILKGYGRIENAGKRRFKAKTGISALEFQLIFKDRKRARRTYRIEVLPLPRIELARNTMRVSRGSSMHILACLEHVRNALITDEQGSTYEFSSGRFLTPPIYRDQSFKIRAIGSHGGVQERTLRINVFDPPEIEKISPGRKRMIYGKAFFRYRLKHATAAVLVMTDRNGKTSKVDLVCGDLEGGTCNLDLAPGSWHAHIRAWNQYGNTIQSETVSFEIIEKTTTRILKALAYATIFLLGCAFAGWLIHLAWPVIEFTWEIIELTILTVWSIVKFIFNTVMFLVRHPWIILVGLFLWFLHEIG